MKSAEKYLSFTTLNHCIEGCRRCPRLVAFRETVAMKLLEGQVGWRRPVAGFGDPRAEVLLVGLAPAANGGNRTGRPFTGDESGRFLMKALYQTGFANQSSTEHRRDGLKLINCYMTAAVKCVPPVNRPTPAEFAACAPYLANQLFLLKRVKVVVALGSLALAATVRILYPQMVPKPQFAHGRGFDIKGGPSLVCCYHPSPRNTYTGRLTLPMMIDLFEEIREKLGTKEK